MRIIYVDAAKSLPGKNGNKVWKCSVIENQANIFNFINSKAKWSIEAEAYAVLATIFWLQESKYYQPVTIYSDCLPVVQKFNKLNKLSNEELIDEWSKIKTKINKTKFNEHLVLSQKIARKHLQITLKWVAGIDNPADAYSRNKK
jgi:ribonuclease HI